MQNGTIGVLLSILAVLIYLWFRFEWQFALAAVVATMHDLILTIGFFSISRIEFNMTSIAAVLTIVGYSLNDTVVVFDRIREVMRKYKRLSTENSSTSRSTRRSPAPSWSPSRRRWRWSHWRPSAAR